MRSSSAAVAFVGRRLRSARSRRAVWLAVPLVMLLLLVLATGGLAHHIYFDRSGVPDLEPFIRFELATTGKVYDARGTVLVELAREYRRVISYDAIPPVLPPLGDQETRGRAALPIFREIMLLTYQQELVGSVPSFPRAIEYGIDRYLQRQHRDRDLGDPPLEDPNRNLAARPPHQGEQSR